MMEDIRLQNVNQNYELALDTVPEAFSRYGSPHVFVLATP